MEDGISSLSPMFLFWSPVMSHFKSFFIVTGKFYIFNLDETGTIFLGLNEYFRVESNTRKLVVEFRNSR